MSSVLARQQRAQLVQESDRDMRQRARKALQALRLELKQARQRRREQLRAVGQQCRAARKAVSARAKAARARLSRSIVRTRTKARDVCTAARGQAHAAALAQIDRAMGQLEAELTEQRRFRAWARPAKQTAGAAGRGRERQLESDDEVEGNLDDPGLRIVWRAVKAKIKPGKHRSRTEAFVEWAAEHAGDVYAIQEADAVRHLEQLEQRERELAKALRKPRGRVAHLLEAVPF